LGKLSSEQKGHLQKKLKQKIDSLQEKSDKLSKESQKANMAYTMAQQTAENYKAQEKETEIGSNSNSALMARLVTLGQSHQKLVKLADKRCLEMQTAKTRMETAKKVLTNAKKQQQRHMEQLRHADDARAGRDKPELTHNVNKARADLQTCLRHLAVVVNRGDGHHFVSLDSWQKIHPDITEEAMGVAQDKHRAATEEHLRAVDAIKAQVQATADTLQEVDNHTSDVVRWLLNKGADMRVPNLLTGKTVLHLTAQLETSKYLKLLLDWSVTDDEEGTGFDMYGIKDNAGGTLHALMVGCSPELEHAASQAHQRHSDRTQSQPRLKHQAAMNARLLDACAHGNLVLAKELFLDPDTEIAGADYDGNGVLHVLSFACTTGSEATPNEGLACACATWLISDEGGGLLGQLHITNNAQATPLHCACAAGNDELAQLFIQRGGDVLALDGNGFSALHLACKSGLRGAVSAIICGEAESGSGPRLSLRSAVEAFWEVRLPSSYVGRLAGPSKEYRKYHARPTTQQLLTAADALLKVVRPDAFTELEVQLEPQLQQVLACGKSLRRKLLATKAILSRPTQPNLGGRGIAPSSSQVLAQTPWLLAQAGKKSALASQQNKGAPTNSEGHDNIIKWLERLGAQQKIEKATEAPSSASSTDSDEVLPLLWVKEQLHADVAAYITKLDTTARRAEAQAAANGCAKMANVPLATFERGGALSFDGLPWDVECTEAVLNWFRKNAQTSRGHEMCALVVKRAREIAEGHWTTSGSNVQGVGITKVLKAGGFTLYETELGAQGRLLWEVGISFSPRRSSDVLGGIYTDVIRLWAVVPSPKQVPREIDKIRTSHKRGQRSVTCRRLQPERDVVDNAVVRLHGGSAPRAYSVILDDSAIEMEGGVRFHPPAHTDPNQYTILKFYGFNRFVFIHGTVHLYISAYTPMCCTQLDGAGYSGPRIGHRSAVPGDRDRAQYHQPEARSASFHPLARAQWHRENHCVGLSNVV
jgi:hypothetical protein